MGKNKSKSDKNSMRDALTNKRIGNKEVICVDNAIEYIKKQGYLVIQPKFIKEITMIVILFMGILLWSSFSSALSFNECDVYGNCPNINISSQITFNNNSGSVNNSQYLEGTQWIDHINGTIGSLCYFNGTDSVKSLASSFYNPSNSASSLAIGMQDFINFFAGNRFRIDTNNGVFDFADVYTIFYSEAGPLTFTAFGGTVNFNSAQDTIINSDQSVVINTGIGSANRNMTVNSENTYFYGNITANNICYSDGTNCSQVQGMNYSHLYLSNQTNSASLTLDGIINAGGLIDQTTNGKFNPNCNNWVLGSGFTCNTLGFSLQKSGNNLGQFAQQNQNLTIGCVYQINYTIYNLINTYAISMAGNSYVSGGSVNGTFSTPFLTALNLNNLTIGGVNGARFNMTNISVVGFCGSSLMPKVNYMSVGAIPVVDQFHNLAPSTISYDNNSLAYTIPNTIISSYLILRQLVGADNLQLQPNINILSHILGTNGLGNGLNATYPSILQLGNNGKDGVNFAGNGANGFILCGKGGVGTQTNGTNGRCFYGFMNLSSDSSNDSRTAVNDNVFTSINSTDFIVGNLISGQIYFDNDSTNGQSMTIASTNTWYNISFSLTSDRGQILYRVNYSDPSLVCLDDGLYDASYSASFETVSGSPLEYNMALSNGTDYYHNTETHQTVGSGSDVQSIKNGGFIRCKENLRIFLIVRQVSGSASNIGIHQAQIKMIRIRN